MGDRADEGVAPLVDLLQQPSAYRLLTELSPLQRERDLVRVGTQEPHVEPVDRRATEGDEPERSPGSPQRHDDNRTVTDAHRRERTKRARSGQYRGELRFGELLARAGDDL